MRMSQRIDSSVAVSDDEAPGTCRRSPIELRTGPIPRSIGPTRTPTVTARTRNAAAAPVQSGASPRGLTVSAWETGSGAAAASTGLQAGGGRRQPAGEDHQ